jgi:hypothetical protein
MARIYAAGFYSTVSQKNAHLLESPPDHVLEAYPAAKRPAVRRAIEESGKRVFLDSGAYVVKSRGKSIDLQEYTNFIRDNQSCIEYAAALDVIDDPEASYDNIRSMEDDLGARMVLPTFHVDEDEKWLERYLDDGHKHICLGGMVRCSVEKLSVWLSRLWPRYLNQPDLKVHGFGLTAPRVLLAFPWYSVDSTTWATAAKHGEIIIKFGPYLDHFARISLATRSPAQCDPLSLKPISHFDLLLPSQQNSLVRQIENKGFTLDDLREEHTSRWLWNYSVLDELAMEIPVNLPVPYRQSWLLHGYVDA